MDDSDSDGDDIIYVLRVFYPRAMSDKGSYHLIVCRDIETVIKRAHFYSTLSVYLTFEVRRYCTSTPARLIHNGVSGFSFPSWNWNMDSQLVYLHVELYAFAPKESIYTPSDRIAKGGLVKRGFYETVVKIGDVGCRDYFTFICDDLCIPHESRKDFVRGNRLDEVFPNYLNSS
jgi:hypothetical protein